MAQGMTRIALFWEILDLLVNAPEPEVLASLSYELDVRRFNPCGINRALAYLREHLTDQIEESELAQMLGQSQSAFRAPSSVIQGQLWFVTAISCA